MLERNVVHLFQPRLKYNKAYTLLRSLWEGYKFLIATVVYLLPSLSGAKKHVYVKQL